MKRTRDGFESLVALTLAVLFVFAARSEQTEPTPAGARQAATKPDARVGHTPPASPATVGRDASSPRAVPPRGWWQVSKRVFVQFSAHRVMAVGAGIVFYTLLSVFPAVAALVSLYGLFADASTISTTLSGLAGVIPDGAVQIVHDQVSRLTEKGGGKLGLGFAISLVAAIWSANQGMKALFDGLNIVYDETEKRSFIRLTLITLCVTACALLFLLVALTGVVVLPIVLKFVGLSAGVQNAIELLRWPLLLVIIGFFLSMIYRIGPSRASAQWQWVSYGGAIAAVLWVIISAAFSYYVSHFGSYNKTYGSLGAVIGFMTWIWISAMVVLIGAEFNAELEHQTGRDSTTGAPVPAGTRGAVKADQVA